MIDLISYDIKEDRLDAPFVIVLKYTDGETETVRTSADLFILLGKDEALELFKDCHVISKD